MCYGRIVLNCRRRRRQRKRRRAVEALGNPELVSRLVGSVHHGRRVLVAVATSTAVAAVAYLMLHDWI